ncbi:MAG: hypothetical protein HY695_02865 [Deltaproteobacteria bacterium]|nr:hypothetical protein [Deltaproteobacteria bacterium]
MGREPTKQGEHVYVCFAVVMLLLCSGCAVAKKAAEKQDERQSILQAQKLLASGDYTGSAKENEKLALRYARRPPGDEAIFNLGLIFADERNANKDYRKAIAFFKKVLMDYPESPLVPQAKIWVGVLEANQKLSQAVQKSRQEIERSKKMIEASKAVDLEIEKMRREKEKGVE